MAWTIEYRQPVQKTIKKLDPVIQRRIKQFLEERLATHDNSEASAILFMAASLVPIGATQLGTTASSAISRTANSSSSWWKSAIAAPSIGNP